MESKNYAEVLIDGEIYTLEGQEEEAYLQKVASYINEKISISCVFSIWKAPDDDRPGPWPSALSAFG